MQYSRVGFVPELIHSKDAKESNIGRSNRSKGITMEDLKKQTALRLAQDQSDLPLQHDSYIYGNGRQQQLGQFHSRNFNNTHSLSSDMPMTYPRQDQHSQDSLNRYHQQYSIDRIPNAQFNPQSDRLQRQYISSQGQDHGNNLQQPSGYVGASIYHHANSMPSQDQNMIPSGTSQSHFIESYQPCNHINAISQQTIPRPAQPLQPSSNVCLPPNTMQLHHQQLFTSYSPDGPQFSTTRTRNISNNVKSKLPHGLTVHELKAMTKARLQSEAAEKSNEFGELRSVSGDPVSPIDFDSGESMRERAMSRDSSSTGRINGNYVSPFLQNHQVSPKLIQTQLQPQSQMVQSGYNPSSIVGVAASSSFRLGTARNDTWESTSVASHNSTIYSDNLGSESASEVGSFGHSSHRNRSFTYPAVQVVQSQDVASTLVTNSGYKESRSFSNPSPVQASPNRGAGVIGGQSLFNAAVGGNRRRAVTLSPNTGSILEDRPFRYDSVEPGDRLEIPNFSSGLSDTNSLSIAPPTQNLNRGYSPVLEQLGIGLENSYRSNGTESSSIFRDVTIKSGSSITGISQNGSIDQDNIRSLPPNAKNKSNVFRSASTTEIRTAAPPPGFMTTSASSDSQTAFSRVGSLDQYCSINSGSKLELSENIQIRKLCPSPEETLVDDFGSVLDLSGSGRRDRERANTYTFGSRLTHSGNSNLKDSFLF